jgi:hypothetical protein
MIRKHLLSLGYKYEVVYTNHNLTHLKAYKVRPSTKSLNIIANRWKCEIGELIIQEIKNEK